MKRRQIDQKQKEQTIKMLKRIITASAMTLFLSIAAFADCQPPVPGQMETPPASQSVDLVTVAEDAITTLLLFVVN